MDKDDGVNDYLSHFENCINQRLGQVQKTINAHFVIYRSIGVDIWEPLCKMVNERMDECRKDADELVVSLKTDVETERRRRDEEEGQRESARQGLQRSCVVS